MRRYEISLAAELALGGDAGLAAELHINPKLGLRSSHHKSTRLVSSLIWKSSQSDRYLLGSFLLQPITDLLSKGQFFLCFACFLYDSISLARCESLGSDECIGNRRNNSQEVRMC
jgi:hypothetical protein